MRISGLCAAAMLATALPQLAHAADDFALERYFAGKTTATGHFGAINGTSRDFTVELTGRWKGQTLTLREDFRFDDGSRDTKTWRFVKTGPGRYQGTREDVIGETEIRVSGKVATFSYLVDLDPSEKQNIVRFHDRMRLRPDGTVLNTALVTKFLFPVARTRVAFSK